MQVRRIVNGSVAYDLEKFKSKPRMYGKTPDLVVVPPTEHTQAQMRIAIVIKIAAVFAIIVAIVATMLYSRAVLTELNQQISREKSVLSEEISEETRLKTHLESKVSLRNVEEYATQILGMSAISKNQMKYIDLSEGDKIELTGEAPKQSVWDKIQMEISYVKRQLG